MRTQHRDQLEGQKTHSNLMPTLLASVVASVSAICAQAQEPVLEEVVVSGTRATIQDSIQLKRNATTIVDGLDADEIGSLPALSIGEALETVTGAASHRENGGATEISVRGMGPFLGTTVVNGREATNGGGNRAVNFSIFPSEMFNAIAIHKTQSASYIEGAVSGQIHLDTRRPIDYGDQRVQFNIKGSAHPDDANISGQDEIGYRATGSYINSWDTENLGTFGISIGAQKRDDSNPEMEATTGTGGGRLEACELSSFAFDAQPLDTDGRCEDGPNGDDISNDELQSVIDGNPNYNSAADVPFAYLARDRRFRRNTTNDEREAIFGALQWMPNDKLDILVDFQKSERDQKELRQDLQFGLTQENITNLVSNPGAGVPQSFTAETDIRANTTDFQRFEDYEGAGLNIAYQVTESLRVSFDAAYSETTRTETDIEINLGATDTLEVENREDFLVSFDLDPAGTDGLGLATIQSLDNGDPISDFNINDPRFFVGRDRAQLRAREIIRENTIEAYRLDLSWDTDKLGFIHTVLGGVRFSNMEYQTFGGNRDRNGVNEFDDEDFDGVAGGDSTDETDAVVVAAANNCGQGSFPESGFLSESRGGDNLFTFEDGFGTGNTWATFNFNCLADTLLQNYGGLAGIGLENGLETNSNDVTEETFAIYLQANYESEVFGKPVRGNFGVRVVETKVNSVGFRSPLTVTEEDGQFFVEAAPAGTTLERVSQSNSYMDVLPSVTFIMDFADDWVFRTGAFSGISRPDPDSFGNGRAVNTNDSDDPDSGFDSLEEAVQGITATGNPQLEPLQSWNIDLAVEWYVNDDTMVTAGTYWKEFQGGFENVFQEEDFIIDGNPVAGSVRTTQVSDEKSELTGFEFTATHALSYLPGFLSGFGVKFSYNYADSDFEFEDGNGGDGISFDDDGNPVQLIGILPSAGLFGLSRHTSSSQIYWQNAYLNIQVLYKTRSQYFQAFTRDTTGRVRYVNDSETVDLRMSYEITDNFSLSAEALNVLGEPRVDFRGVDGNVAQTLEYGPRLFFGVRAKF